MNDAQQPETPLLSARCLTLARRGRTILDQVDLSIASREIVTVIGPNGAGKTTLVRVLLGLEKPDSGTVVRAPATSLGYLPQLFSADPTIPLTVARFLTLTRRVAAERVEEGLVEVGAGHLANAQLAELSGGELQRVALARALIGDPELLVLDEPVQNVDYSGVSELYALIGKIRDTRGCGILLVSHDLHVVLGASDRVLCLNRHICCSGVPESVAKHPEYLRLFGPDAADVYAVYSHAHDHVHDLSGDVCDDHEH
ncbi:MAG: metal ABC transporter ATP-binding protein [Hyphomicrobiales bacterium]|nr:metal ABC transporter ATP-binding protein [Hyphomicrobiales bacterium]